MCRDQLAAMSGSEGLLAAGTLHPVVPAVGPSGLVGDGSGFVETRGQPSSMAAGFCQWLCCGSCSFRGGNGDHWGLRFPRSGQEFQNMGADWVTLALRTSQMIAPDNACTSLHVEPLGASGLLGEMVLVKWTFAADVSFAPEVVAKFAPTGAKVQAISTILGLFATEFHYYKYLADASPVRTPHMIFGDIHYSSSRFILILEKVEGTRNFLEDQLPDSEIEQMMCTLARFHAPYLGGSTENDIAFTPDIEQDSQIGLIVKLVAPTSSWNKMAKFLQEGATLYFSTANRTPSLYVYSLYSVLCWRVLLATRTCREHAN